MKIALASDLHLEFEPIVLENTEGAEVLLLAGDICEAVKFEKRLPFFEQVARDFPLVIYILGNHEHYDYDFKYTAGDLKKQLAHLKNVILLDTETYTHGDVTFIGGTLWTDMNKEDPNTIYAIKGMMNDFRCVTNSKNVTYFRDADGNSHERIAKFAPEEAVVDHKEMLEYIRLMVEGKFDQKFVVVGHHCPSKLSTKPQYEKDVIMNGGYSSDLSEFILDHPQIKLWTHGHTHHKFDYMIGSTRIVCNPRGYIDYEPEADSFELQFIEV